MCERCGHVPAVACLPIDTEENRLHAALKDVEWTFSLPDGVKGIESTCDIHGGRVWLSMESANARAAFIMAKREVYTVCFICVKVLLRGREESDQTGDK